MSARTKDVPPHAGRQPGEATSKPHVATDSRPPSSAGTPAALIEPDLEGAIATGLAEHRRALELLR